MAGAYYDQNQGIGYASTPFGVPRPQSGVDIRHLRFMPNAMEYSSFGIMRDNSVLKSRIEGSGRRMRGGSYKGFSNSGMAPTSFGGGNTSNDPGAYNWDTAQRNIDRMVNAAFSGVDYVMQNKRFAAAKQQQNAQNQLNTFANNTITTAQNVATGMQAKSSKLTPGASMPINSPRPTTVNLLGKPGKVPANSKQRNQNQTTKRKSSAPPLNTQTAP